MAFSRRVREILCIFLMGFFLVQLTGCAGLSQGNGGKNGNGGGGATVPSTPSGLAATAGNAQVSLSWSASSGATGYYVKRASASGGPYTQIASPQTNSYTDGGLTNGAIYYYVVSAFNSAGQSANSGQVSATPTAPPVPPATPTGLQATAGNAQVSLTWTTSSGATSYHVKRSTTSGGPYTQISAPTAPNFTDPSLTNGTTYYYVVSALNSAGESANSSQVSATPTAPASPPAAPAGLQAAAGNAQVILTWTASSGATSYHVKRGTTSGGPYTQVAAPTSTSYTDTGLTNGTTYYYVVSALNATGESANSSQVSATPANATADVTITVNP
ncbi:MAG: fibronectin type III domain-containing protein, partial [Candidatus Acidiferrum sp.]